VCARTAAPNEVNISNSDQTNINNDHHPNDDGCWWKLQASDTNNEVNISNNDQSSTITTSKITGVDNDQSSLRFFFSQNQHSKG